MTTKNFRTTRRFNRETELTSSAVLKGSQIRNFIFNSQDICATGKHHFSCWFHNHNYSSSAGIVSSSFTDNIFSTKVTPSINTTNLQCNFFLQPNSQKISGSLLNDTGSQFQVSTLSNKLVYIAPGANAQNRVASLEEVRILLPVTGGVETEFYCKIDKDNVLKGITLYDEPKQFLSSSHTGHIDISSTFQGKVLTAGLIQSASNVQSTILNNFRQDRLNVSSLHNSCSLETFTPLTTWSNAFDTSVTTFSTGSSGSPGFWFRPGACWKNNRHTKFTIKVKAGNSSGTGSMRFLSSDNQISPTLQITSSEPYWQSTKMYVETPENYKIPYDNKIDLQIKRDNTMQQIDLYNLIFSEEEEKPTSAEVFRFGDSDSVLSSVENLPARLTIVSGSTTSSITPMFRYEGKNATTASWVPSTYGSTMPVAGAGNEITCSQPCPFLKSTDKTVKANAGKCYQAANGTTYDISTEDFIFEWVGQMEVVGGENKYIYSKGGNDGLSVFASLGGDAKLTARLYESGSIDSFDIVSAVLTDKAWYHAICFCNRSGSGQWYVNGEKSGTATDISGAISIENTGKATLFDYSDSIGSATNIPILGHAYFAMYTGSNLMSTASQGDIAKERFDRLTGIYPQISRGTATPTYTRDSTAWLLKSGSNKQEHHLVGAGYPRIEKVSSSVGGWFTGYRSERAATNLCSYSETFNSWTKTNITGVSSSMTTAPTPFEGKYFDGIIGTNANVAHAINLAAFTDNLSADRHVFSCYHSGGIDDFVRYTLYQTSLGYVTAYFDLANQTIGGLSQCEAGIVDCGNGISRCWMSPTSSCYAEAANFFMYISDGFGDATTQGDGVSVQLYSFGGQMEVGTYPSSYVEVPATTAQTRAADRLYFAAANNANTSSSPQGTIQLETLILGNPSGSDTDHTLISLSNENQSANTFDIRWNTGSTNNLEMSGSGGTNDIYLTSSNNILDNQNHIIKCRYKTDTSNYLKSDNVQIIAENTSSIAPSPTRINIGTDCSGSNNADNCWIKKIQIKKVSTDL